MYWGEPWNPIPEHCDFKCLNCKISPCLFDDPDYPLAEPFEPIVSEDYWEGWRWNHKCYNKPKNPLKKYCPRCFSTKIKMTYELGTCKKCGFVEELIDFPCNLFPIERAWD